MPAPSGWNKTKSEGPAEEEYGVAFAEVGGVSTMFKKEALLFPYPE
jgi:hypothetical protein